jgi:hypothetical protein
MKRLRLAVKFGMRRRAEGPRSSRKEERTSEKEQEKEEE